MASNIEYVLEDTKDRCYRDMVQILKNQGWNKVPHRKLSKLEKKRFPNKLRPFLIWVLNEKDIEFDNLASYQICNHYENIEQLTTKQGFSELLHDLSWLGANSSDISPRCYNLSDPNHRLDFIDEFQLSAATNIIKWYILKKCIQTSNNFVDEMHKTSRPFEDTYEFLKILKLSTTACLWHLRVITYGEWPGVDRCRTFLDKDESLTEKQWNRVLHMSYYLAEIENYWDYMDGQYLRQHLLYATHISTDWQTFKPFLIRLRLILTSLSQINPQFFMNGYKNIWILKPPDISCGIGMKLFYKLSDIFECEKGMGCRTAQKYIENPLLVPLNESNLQPNLNFNNRFVKFDIRVWVLVTSFYPKIKVSYYSRVYGRRCFRTYNSHVISLSDTMVHLTNYSIQRNQLQTDFKKIPSLECSDIISSVTSKLRNAVEYSRTSPRSLGNQDGAEDDNLKNSSSVKESPNKIHKTVSSPGEHSPSFAKPPCLGTVPNTRRPQSAGRRTQVDKNSDPIRKTRRSLCAGMTDSCQEKRAKEADLLMNHEELMQIIDQRCMQIVGYLSEANGSNKQKSQLKSSMISNPLLFKLLRQEVDSVKVVGQIDGEFIWKQCIWPEMKRKIKICLQATQSCVVHRERSFELLGFDVMLDSDLVPWILEVNMSPAMAHRTEEQSNRIYEMMQGLAERVICPYAPLTLEKDLNIQELWEDEVVIDEYGAKTIENLKKEQKRRLIVKAQVSSTRMSTVGPMSVQGIRMSLDAVNRMDMHCNRSNGHYIIKRFITKCLPRWMKYRQQCIKLQSIIRMYLASKIKTHLIRTYKSIVIQTLYRKFVAKKLRLEKKLHRAVLFIQCFGRHQLLQRRLMKRLQIKMKSKLVCWYRYKQIRWKCGRFLKVLQIIRHFQSYWKHCRKLITGLITLNYRRKYRIYLQLHRKVRSWLQGKRKRKFQCKRIIYHLMRWNFKRKWRIYVMVHRMVRQWLVRRQLVRCHRLNVLHTMAQEAIVMNAIRWKRESNRLQMEWEDRCSHYTSRWHEMMEQRILNYILTDAIMDLSRAMIRIELEDLLINTLTENQIQKISVKQKSYTRFEECVPDQPLIDTPQPAKPIQLFPVQTYYLEETIEPKIQEKIPQAVTNVNAIPEKFSSVSLSWGLPKRSESSTPVQSELTLRSSNSMSSIPDETKRDVVVCKHLHGTLGELLGTDVIHDVNNQDNMLLESYEKKVIRRKSARHRRKEDSSSEMKNRPPKAKALLFSTKIKVTSSDDNQQDTTDHRSQDLIYSQKPIIMSENPSLASHSSEVGEHLQINSMNKKSSKDSLPIRSSEEKSNSNYPYRHQSKFEMQKVYEEDLWGKIFSEVKKSKSSEPTDGGHPSNEAWGDAQVQATSNVSTNKLLIRYDGNHDVIHQDEKDKKVIEVVEDEVELIDMIVVDIVMDPPHEIEYQHIQMKTKIKKSKQKSKAKSVMTPLFHKPTKNKAKV